MEFLMFHITTINSRFFVVARQQLVLPVRALRRFFTLALPSLAIAAAGAQPNPRQELNSPAASYDFAHRSRTHVLAPAPEVLTLRFALAKDAEVQRAAQSFLDQPGTTALALINKGEIVFADYSKGATRASRFTSFSIAKTLTALAVGEALCAGKIGSLDDLASRYAPELAGTAYGESSIKNLLMMASGAKGGTTAGHGSPYPNAPIDELNGRKLILEQLREFGGRASGLFSEVKPGSRFEYNNLDTAALAWVLRGATGMEFAEWFHQSVITKSGLEQSSHWHTDRDGKALAYKAYNATLEDWIRLALRFRSILQGTDDSPCLKNYVGAATGTQIRITHPWFQGYGYQTWTRYRWGSESTFWMLGYGGQRIAYDTKADKILITFAWKPEDRVFEFFNLWTQR